MLWLINDQQNLELLGEGWRGSRLLHKASSRCGCLFDHIGDGAEGAEEARGTTGGGLGLLRLLSLLARAPLLSCRRAGRHLGRSWSFGWGRGRSRRCTLLGRGGGSGGRRSRWVRPLEVCHVAIGKVGHEAAVRETASEEVHDCGRKVGPSVGQLVSPLILGLNGVKAEAGLISGRMSDRKQVSPNDRGMRVRELPLQKERMDEAMDTALVQSSRDSSPKCS